MGPPRTEGWAGLEGPRPPSVCRKRCTRGREAKFLLTRKQGPACVLQVCLSDGQDLCPEPVWGGLLRWVWHKKGVGAPLPTEQSCSEGSRTLGRCGPCA